MMSNEWLKLGTEAVVYSAKEYKEGKWLHCPWLSALELTGDEWIVSMPSPPFALGGIDAIFLEKEKADRYVQLQQENERLQKRLVELRGALGKVRTAAHVPGVNVHDLMKYILDTSHNALASTADLSGKVLVDREQWGRSLKPGTGPLPKDGQSYLTWDDLMGYQLTSYGEYKNWGVDDDASTTGFNDGMHPTVFDGKEPDAWWYLSKKEAQGEGE